MSEKTISLHHFLWIYWLCQLKDFTFHNVFFNVTVSLNSAGWRWLLRNRGVGSSQDSKQGIYEFLEAPLISLVQERLAINHSRALLFYSICINSTHIFVYFCVSTEQGQDPWVLVGADRFVLWSPFTRRLYSCRTSAFQGRGQTCIILLICAFTVELTSQAWWSSGRPSQERPRLVSRDSSENQFSWFAAMDWTNGDWYLLFFTWMCLVGLKINQERDVWSWNPGSFFYLVALGIFVIEKAFCLWKLAASAV